MPISKKIYTHRLSLAVTEQQIEMPVGSEILSVLYDGIHLRMSVLSPPYMLPADNPPVEIRHFIFLRTGEEFTIDDTDQLIFITTIPLISTDIHFFEIKTINQ